MDGNFAVISGRSGEHIKNEVVKSLIAKYHCDEQIDLPGFSKDFSCGEIFTQIGKNMAKKNIHFFQSFYDPKTYYYINQILNSNMEEDAKKELLMRSLTENRDIMEMLNFGDAIKRSRTGNVLLYMTMLPYSRQDKKDDGRVPISAKLMADLIERAFGKKLEAVNVCDLHAQQEQGFFDGPVLDFPIIPLYAIAIRNNFELSDKVVVQMADNVIMSPDSGGLKRAESLGNLLKLPFNFVPKKRPKHGEAEVRKLVEMIQGKSVIFVDDIGDSYNSLLKAREFLIRDCGANELMYACITHNVASISYNDKGERRVPEQTLDGKIKLITTNTVPRELVYYEKNKNIYQTVINLGEPFADLVYCHQSGKTTGDVFDTYKQMAKTNDLKSCNISKLLLYNA